MLHIFSYKMFKFNSVWMSGAYDRSLEDQQLQYSVQLQFPVFLAIFSTSKVNGEIGKKLEVTAHEILG